MPCLILATVLGLSACSLHHSATEPIYVGDVQIGMSKASVLARYGQPFTFDTKIVQNDTITVMSYKTLKDVVYQGFIVTTKLRFVNDRLQSISQHDFFIPSNVIYCDTTAVATRPAK